MSRKKKNPHTQNLITAANHLPVLPKDVKEWAKGVENDIKIDRTASMLTATKEDSLWFVTLPWELLKKGFDLPTFLQEIQLLNHQIVLFNQFLDILKTKSEKLEEELEKLDQDQKNNEQIREAYHSITALTSVIAQPMPNTMTLKDVFNNMQNIRAAAFRVKTSINKYKRGFGNQIHAAFYQNVTTTIQSIKTSKEQKPLTLPPSPPAPTTSAVPTTSPATTSSTAPITSLSTTSQPTPTTSTATTSSTASTATTITSRQTAPLPPPTPTTKNLKVPPRDQKKCPSTIQVWTLPSLPKPILQYSETKLKTTEQQRKEQELFSQIILCIPTSFDETNLWAFVGYCATIQFSSTTIRTILTNARDNPLWILHLSMDNTAQLIFHCTKDRSLNKKETDALKIFVTRTQTLVSNKLQPITTSQNTRKKNKQQTLTKLRNLNKTLSDFHNIPQTVHNISISIITFINQIPTAAAELNKHTGRDNNFTDSILDIFYSEIEKNKSHRKDNPPDAKNNTPPPPAPAASLTTSPLTLPPSPLAPTTSPLAPPPPPPAPITSPATTTSTVLTTSTAPTTSPLAPPPPPPAPAASLTTLPAPTTSPLAPPPPPPAPAASLTTLPAPTTSPLAPPPPPPAPAASLTTLPAPITSQLALPPSPPAPITSPATTTSTVLTTSPATTTSTVLTTSPATTTSTVLTTSTATTTSTVLTTSPATTTSTTQSTKDKKKKLETMYIISAIILSLAMLSKISFLFLPITTAIVLTIVLLITMTISVIYHLYHLNTYVINSDKNVLSRAQCIFVFNAIFCVSVFLMMIVPIINYFITAADVTGGFEALVACTVIQFIFLVAVFITWSLGHICRKNDRDVLFTICFSRILSIGFFCYILASDLGFITNINLEIVTLASILEICALAILFSCAYRNYNVITASHTQHSP